MINTEKVFETFKAEYGKMSPEEKREYLKKVGFSFDSNTNSGQVFKLMNPKGVVAASRSIKGVGVSSVKYKASTNRKGRVLATRVGKKKTRKVTNGPGFFA